MLLVGCAGSVTSGRAEVRAHASLNYTLRVDRSITTLEESICWNANGPEALRTSASDGIHALRSISSVSGKPVRHNGNLLDLTALEDADCVLLTIELSGLADRRVLNPPSGEIPPSVWLPTDAWLWFDDDDARRSHGTVRWSLPDGVDVATPWATDDDGVSHIRREDFDWKTIIAIGDLEHRTFRFKDTTVHLTALDPSHVPSHAVIDGWLGHALGAVASLYGGKFPCEEFHVFLIPTEDTAAEPVVFGMVARGGARPTVSLFLSSDASADVLRGEWVAIHEFLHLGMPYVASQDAWISEGFVTYMTEVLRSRFGYFNAERDFPSSIAFDVQGASATEAQALMALATLELGVTRGVRESSKLNLSLRDASARLGELHAFMLVYWGGASVAILLDRNLRAMNVGLSVDELFRRWAKLRGEPKKIWLATELLSDPRVLDGMPPAAVPALVDAGEAANATPVRFAGEVLQQLGLRFDPDGRVFSLAYKESSPSASSEDSSATNPMLIFAADPSPPI